jgi:phosphoglycolate phosphatase-like HAD superfamily hydrolase
VRLAACCRAIGARVIAVATGNHTHAELAAAGPDHLVNDFADLEAVLALWR